MGDSFGLFSDEISTPASKPSWVLIFLGVPVTEENFRTGYTRLGGISFFDEYLDWTNLFGKLSRNTFAFLMDE